MSKPKNKTKKLQVREHLESMLEEETLKVEWIVKAIWGKDDYFTIRSFDVYYSSEVAFLKEKGYNFSRKSRIIMRQRNTPLPSF